MGTSILSLEESIKMITRILNIAIIICIILPSSSFAQKNNHDDMIDSILESVNGQVFIYSPTISDLKLAEAIRRTVLDNVRKVDMEILTVPYYNHLPESHILSLALIGTKIREQQVPSNEGIVIVDSRGWIGKKLGRTEGDNIRVMSSDEVRKFILWMKKNTKNIKPITKKEAFKRIERILK